MTQQVEVILKPKNRGFHLVTDEVINALPKLPKVGLLHIFIKHTSAGLTINENADPTVRDDFEMMMNKIVPENDPDYKHTFEGPDDMPAHIKSSMMGSSISIPITNYQLNTGIWQGIYLCEFRNSGGARKLVVTITGD